MPLALQAIDSCLQCSPLGGSCSSGPASTAENETIATISVTCECVHGYTHDTLGFRFASCALPSYYYVTILAVGLGFSNLATLMMICRAPRAKGEARTLIIMFGLIPIFFSAACVSALVQGYLGALWFFFIACFFTGMGLTFARFLYLFIRICYGALDKASWTQNMGWIKRLLVMLVLSLAVPNFAYFGAVVSLGDPLDPAYDVKTFNLILLVSISSNPIYLFISWPLGKLVTDDLIAKIDRVLGDIPANASTGTRNRSQLANVRQRMVMFRKINLVYTPASQIPIMWIILPLVFALFVPALPFVYGVCIPSLGMFTSAEILILSRTAGLVDSNEPGKSGGVSMRSKSSSTALEKKPQSAMSAGALSL